MYLRFSFHKWTSLWTSATLRINSNTMYEVMYVVQKEKEEFLLSYPIFRFVPLSFLLHYRGRRRGWGEKPKQFAEKRLEGGGGKRRRRGREKMKWNRVSKPCPREEFASFSGKICQMTSFFAWEFEYVIFFVFGIMPVGATEVEKGGGGRKEEWVGTFTPPHKTPPPTLLLSCCSTGWGGRLDSFVDCGTFPESYDVEEGGGKKEKTKMNSSLTSWLLNAYVWNLF